MTIGPVRWLAQPLAILVALGSIPGQTRTPFIIQATCARPAASSTAGAPDPRVYVNGSARPVLSISVLASPVTTLLLLDSSASSIAHSLSFISPAWDPRRELAAVVGREFVGRLSPPHRLRIGSFGAELSLSDGYSTDRRASVRAVGVALAPSEQDQRGPSPIWDVVAEAVASLRAEPGPRVLVLLTDGEVTGNIRSVDEVALGAVAASVTIHVVSAAVDQIIPQKDGLSLHARPSAGLSDLAELTGGVFLQAPGAEREYRPQLSLESGDSHRRVRTHVFPPLWDPDPGQAFAQVARQLDVMCAIELDVSDLEAGVHTLDVRSTNPAAPVRAPTRLILPGR